MTSPVFVSFTQADSVGATVYVSTQAPIAYVTPYLAAQGKPGSVTNASVIQFTGGTQLCVSGTPATVYAALGVNAPTGPDVLTNTPQGTVALASYGTDAVSTANTAYWSSGYNPCDRLVSFIEMLNGTTGVGTDLQVFALWNSVGTPLVWTALAGTLAATADVFQSIAVVTPTTIPAGLIFGGFVVNGTTTPHQTIATLTYPNFTGTTAWTLGAAAPTIVPTTTTTAGVGPFWRLR